MKTRAATIISVIGVLTAGTAAAMVNTQIFQSEPTVANESSAMLAPDPTTVGLSIESDSSTSTSIDALTSEGTLTEYLIGDAGSVTVDVVDGELRILSVSAFDGWTVIDQEEKPDEDRIEVDFASGSVTVEFDASYIDGQIVPEIDAQQTTVATTDSTATTSPRQATSSTMVSTTGSTSPGSYDDDHGGDSDDDDEEDHDDDHDDDHDEDHDDD